MPTCREVARTIAAGRDQITWRTRLSIRLHLLKCPPCRRFAAQLRTIGAAVRKLLRAESRDRERLDRLERAVLRNLPGTEVT